jgi:hypothetical protein
LILRLSARLDTWSRATIASRSPPQSRKQVAISSALDRRAHPLDPRAAAGHPQWLGGVAQRTVEQVQEDHYALGELEWDPGRERLGCELEVAVDRRTRDDRRAARLDEQPHAAIRFRDEPDRPPAGDPSSEPGSSPSPAAQVRT